MKILIDVAVEPAALAALRQAGLHDIAVITPPAEVARPIDAAQLKGVEALFCTFPPTNAAELRELKWIQLASTGYSQLFGLDLNISF